MIAAPRPLLTTARLALRQLTPFDARAIAAYHRDPRVAQYQGWGLDDDGAFERDLREMAARPPLAVAGPWSQLGVYLADLLVGDIGVRLLPDEPTVELGYTIDPAHQRRGFATEAVTAVTTWALTRADRVIATIDQRNTASLTVAARAGFTPVHHAPTKHAGEPTTFVTYERRR